MSNSLDPGQARCFVGPDLDPSCLQRLSADDTSRRSVNSLINTRIDGNITLVCYLPREISLLHSILLTCATAREISTFISQVSNEGPGELHALKLSVPQHIQ